MQGERVLVKNNSGLRLNMDLGTSLQIEIQGLDAKIKTKLIGMETWEYLILKAPTGYTGIRNKMVEGNKVVVRYVQEGSVYGFEAYILGVLEKPVSLLVIDYPRAVEEKTLRKTERRDCYIICTLGMDGEESEGVLVDISATGCRCIAPNIRMAGGKAEPKLDSPISIVFDSPAEDWQMVPEGLIVNTAEHHATARLGIRFTEGIEDKLDHIEKLLAHFG